MCVLPYCVFPCMTPCPIAAFDIFDTCCCRASSGEKASEEIRRLLATLLVLFVVFGWTRATFIHSTLTSELRKVLTEETTEVWKRFQRRCPVDAVRYVLDVESRRPLVYSVLQLGHSWIDVVCGFLGEPPPNDEI
jgi:hypothetical protein